MKKTIWFSMVLGSVLSATSALAEMSSHVALEGKVGDFNEKSVELEVQGGARVRVPRAGVQGKEEELRPGRTVVAIARLDEIAPVAVHK